MTYSSKYIIGDSRNVEKIIKNEKNDPIDLVLTSPPYFNIKNYENSNLQIGHNQSYENYLSDTTSVLQQCYNLSKEDATLWLVLDTVRKKNRTIPLPFDINSKLQTSYCFFIHYIILNFNFIFTFQF